MLGATLSLSIVQKRSSVGEILLSVGMLALSGCGQGYERETAAVTGRVTLDGKPLASGYVSVTPASGRMARGAIASDGTFELTTYRSGDGVQLGTHPVTVIPVPADEGGKKASGPEAPPQYGVASTSGLTITVEPGENEIELPLVSKPH